MSEYTIGILILACVNLISVLGLSLLTGFTGQFNFGQAGFMAIGAYTAAILTTRLGVPLAVAVAAAMAMSGLASVLIGYPTLRLKGDYFAIGTLGFAEAIRLVIENFDKLTGGSRGIPRINTYTTLPVALAAVAVALIVVASYIGSTHGRNCIAVREDEMAAEAIGVDAFRYKQVSFAVNAVLAGLSGALLAHYVGFIQPSMFGLVKSTEMIVIVIFGGMQSLTGAVIATFLLTALPEVLRAAMAWRLVLYGVLVVFIMIVRPEGIMGTWELSPTNIKAAFGRSRAKAGPRRREGGVRP